MQRTVEAIFSDGVLRPVEALDGLAENQRVLVTITPSPGTDPLAGWSGGLSDEDARQMIQTIESEFENVDPNDWK